MYKSVISIGSTRSGKSMAACRRLVDAAMQGAALVVIDPHRDSLAAKLFEQLVARGFQKRILYDRLSDLDRTLGYDFFPKPVAASPLEFLSELDEAVRAFADLLCRRREMASLATSPLLEEWVNAALTLYMEQEDHPPLPILSHAFGPPDHPDFLRLLRRCRNEEVVAKFREIERGKIQRSQYVPAERLIRSVCQSPVFGARCGASFRLGPFLDRRGILLVEGGGSGSADAQRTVMGALILLTIRYVRTRARPTPPVLLVLDEANNANLVGASGYETRAAAECQKMGLAIHVLVQNMNFPTSDITESLLTNCLRHEWFFAGSAAVIRQAIADLGSKDYEERLRSLRPGERLVKDRDEGIFWEYVPLLEDLWGLPGLAKKKADRALREILQRPEYRTPRFEAGRFVDDAEAGRCIGNQTGGQKALPAPSALPEVEIDNPNLGI